jgi:glycosyltransferase involved in cell wall biosynthesis
MHLVLWLSRAVPLSRWDEMGILERELALYQSFSLRLDRLSIVTCGGMEELTYGKYLGNICLLYNRWGLSPNAYSLLAPFLHWKALRTGTVYKTNQLDGAWSAVIAGRVHRKPVVVRAGYMWSKNFRRTRPPSLKAAVIDHLEAFAVETADGLVLTTEIMKQHVIERYNVQSDKIDIVPNYVDTVSFRPMPELKPVQGRVCYVGRLNPVKNLLALIEAVAQIPDASLVLIGQGEQRAELEAYATHCGANVRFLGILRHDCIPAEINRSDIFVLPSRFEGHPKALIEAMSCAAAVVGTDVEGIRDVIRHGETGLLCPPTVEGITVALRQLLDDADLRRRLGKEARAFVEREYNLKHVVERELAVLWRVQNERPNKQQSSI